MSHAKTINKTSGTQKTHPESENAASASYVAKRIYRSLRRFFKGMNTHRAYGHLRGRLLKAMADSTGRSARLDLLSGNLSLLEGFEFNEDNCTPQPILKKCLSVVVENDMSGFVHLPAINPQKDIIAPVGTMYFKLFVLLIIINHKTGDYQTVVHDWMGYHPVDRRIRSRQQWRISKKLEGKSILVTAFGIKFYDFMVEEIVGGIFDRAAASFVIHKALPC